MTVFFETDETQSTRVTVDVAATNLFYAEREVFGGLINMLQVGEVSLG